MDNLTRARHELQSVGVDPAILDDDELVIVCEGLGKDVGACAEPLVTIDTESQALGVLRALAALEGHPDLRIAATGADTRTAPVRARTSGTWLAESGLVEDADFLDSTGSIVANAGDHGLPASALGVVVRAAGILLGVQVTVNAGTGEKRPALYLVLNE